MQSKTNEVSIHTSKKIKPISESSFYKSNDQSGKRQVLRIKVETFYLTNFWGRTFERCIGASSFIISILFVVLLYFDNEPPNWFRAVNFVMICTLIFDLIVRFYISTHRIPFLYSRDCLVDFFVIVPIFMPGGNGDTYIFFESTSFILRSVIGSRILIKNFRIGETEVSRQIVTILITLSLVVYIAAGMIMISENLNREDDNKLQFHQAIYFVIVTLATVGYGEIYPDTELGKIFVICVMIVTIVIIPRQTSELLRLLELQSVYARAIYKSNLEIPHIICTGKVTLDALKNFCDELFDDDHGITTRNLVILQPGDPNSACELFLNGTKLKYEIFLTFLNGDPLTKAGLKKCDLHKSKDCIILTNKNSRDPQSSDHKNILIALAVKKYVFEANKDNRKTIRLCIQLIKPESKIHYMSSLKIPSKDQLIIVEEIKMNLLAKSCFAPGLIALLSNLTSSRAGYDSDLEKKDWMKDWLKDYMMGMDYEIYRTSLNPNFEGLSFKEIAKIIYKEFSIIAFALGIESQDQSVVVLNPVNFRCEDMKNNKYYIFIITEGPSGVEKTETLRGISRDNKKRYFGNKKQQYISKEINFDQQDRKESEDELGEYVNFDINDDTEFSYFKLNKAQSQMDATVTTSLKNDKKIKNHIVVCGIHCSIKHFILPLRASYLQDYQHIVIVSQGSIPLNIWDEIKKFPMIHLVNGSPLEQESLIKANILNADKAVILGHDPTLKTNLHDEMLDAQSIFIYKAIKKLNPELPIITELVYESKIDFLLPKKNKHKIYTLSTLFASGMVYISAIIDTITAQSYHNPHIVSLLNLILKGTERDRKTAKWLKTFQNLTHANLWQIPAPEGLYNKSFSELFLHLLEKGLIAIALYRLPGATDNKSPYVWTNPEGATITNQDRVFVFADKIPKDLNIHSEEFEANDNNEHERNQYNIFGHRSEGDIVKNYYGEEFETIDEDSKYPSDSSQSSEEEPVSATRSGRTSPQILFSNLGGATDTALKEDKIKDIASPDIEETKDIRTPNDSTSKISGGNKGGTNHDTRKTLDSTSKNTQNFEMNPVLSSLATTKMIIP
ncbi:unnamed protein product [Moneuplotes crassus]|uniref:RCK N-terminal domain-containing protein n=2 Tax=Euplotes crassus TaxID=5936 RepID=A0AAD1XLH2_EUPCR|nr:unnamed protein product [Moneuplotes crassus]